MAELVSAEDLTEFLESLRTMETAASVYNASDLVGLNVKYVKGDLRNTQDYLSLSQKRYV